MLFNSIPYLVFFIIFFCLYWFVFNRNIKLQNLLLLVASYVFYCWWDWRFLTLLIAYSLINYLLGIYIYKASSQRAKNVLTYTGVLIGLGLLFYFKYADFFIHSLVAAFARFKIQLDIQTIGIALPLGISFYTFKTLSYLFDINKGKLQPTNDILVFFSYIAFFPCLLAGPIDKAQLLIPQLERKRTFNYEQAEEAMRLIIYGMFKKVVIADSLTPITNNVFSHYHIYPGSTLVIGAFYYAIQIYADFSGYSDMALGFAGLIGFKVTRNFDFPFFSQNIGEFWRKWHISLTKWLTEYVFTPLSIAFRDYGKLGLVMAVIINLVTIGIWHGANWTFAAFGLIHALYFIPLILNGTMNKTKKRDPNKRWPTLTELRNMLSTFILANLAFIIFRSDSIGQAFGFIRRILSPSLFKKPEDAGLTFLPLIFGFLLFEWLKQNAQLRSMVVQYKYGFYVVIGVAVYLYFGKEAGFIYFKF